MDAESFLATVETAIRRLLPSLFEYRMRPPNNSLWVSFGAVDDFVTFVMAATGANVEMTIGATFREKRSSPKSLKSCYLCLKLENACLDKRILMILTDILNIRFSGGLLTAADRDAVLRDLDAFRDNESDMAPR